MQQSFGRYHFSRSHCQWRPFSICLNFSSFLYSSLSICLSHFILSLSLMDVMWGLNGEIDQELCVEAVRLLGLCERRLFPKLLQPPDACQKTLSVKVRLCLSLPPSLPLSLFTPLLSSFSLFSPLVLSSHQHKISTLQLILARKRSLRQEKVLMPMMDGL